MVLSTTNEPETTRDAHMRTGAIGRTLTDVVDEDQTVWREVRGWEWMHGAAL